MQNLLMDRLSDESLSAFKKRAVSISVPRNVYWEDLSNGDNSFFFPESGLFSQVVANGNDIVEVQMIGQDGFIGSLFARYGAALVRHISVIQATGYKLSIKDFDELSGESEEFDRLCRCFSNVILNRVAQSTACFQLHSIEQRAAKWLVTSHRLSNQAVLITTQKELSNLIGCARPGLNIALVNLQKKGLLDLSRSSIELVNIPGLEAASCECYNQQLQLYKNSMGFDLVRVLGEVAA